MFEERLSLDVTTERHDNMSFPRPDPFVFRHPFVSSAFFDDNDDDEFNNMVHTNTLYTVYTALSAYLYRTSSSFSSTYRKALQNNITHTRTSKEVCRFKKNPIFFNVYPLRTTEV